MKKVLVIGYVWPEPNSSAAGYQMLATLRVYTQQGWSVEFASPAQQTEQMADLSAVGITTQAIALNDDRFDAYLKAYQPDIVHFDRFMMEEQFGWRVDQHCPEAMKILDTVDLQCLRGARHEAHKASRVMNQQDLSSDLAKREMAAILRCDLALVISTYEMQLLQQQFGVDKQLLHHLPFMVDLVSLPKTTRHFTKRQHFMTIGNFRHAPNWDAVLYLQSIWPLIRKQLPEADLHIYGAYPPAKAMALHHPASGFLMKGWAPSVAEVMEGARVCLAPLRFGAGLKGKLLDAMVTQTPSVTTAIGAEGMLAPDTIWPGAIADDADAFAEAAVTLYRDQAAWQLAQQQTTIQLKTQFDAATLAPKLIAHIQTIRQRLEQHRLDNFTGAMLKHHTMTSTKYLSKWIMEKHKNE